MDTIAPQLRQAAGILRHEFSMLARRKSVWITYGMVSLVYACLPVVQRIVRHAVIVDRASAWQFGGQMVFQFNMFMVLAAGVIAADCLERDYRTGVRELQHSVPCGRWSYLGGKYAGTLGAVLTPYFVSVLLFGAALVALRAAPFAFIPALLCGFLAMAIPACAFAVAFSMACPLILPVRVYQILFTSYWFWGNYLDPNSFPTLNGTLATPSGVYAFEAFFGGFRWARNNALHTPAEASLNLTVLAVCVATVLFVLERSLAWRERHA